MSTSNATLTYRRLQANAPVGLLAKACLELHPRRVGCARCVEACPVKVLSLTDRELHLDEGCLGCGHCAAACPTGALAVRGFSLALTPEPTLEALTLDCWKVPEHLSPPSAVRVPCLGGLSVSHLLALRYVAGSRQFALLDRSWCDTCAAGGPDAHPAQAALAEARELLRDLGAPTSHWPAIERRPLPRALQREIQLDETTPAIKRRDFFSRIAREVAATVSDVAAFRIEDGAAGKAPPVRSLAPLRAIEREHRLLLLEQLAARYGGSVPARIFPLVRIRPDCRDHRLCVNLCPTGALGVYETREARGVSFEAAACIACGQCQQICPEHAIRLQPQPRRVSSRESRVTLTRHALNTCVECGETFSANGRETYCPTCCKSTGFARAGFDTLFREATKQKGRHKH